MSLLHMLGEIFGMKNFTPPSSTQAHFNLEHQGVNYILDAELKQEVCFLCLSRELLPHEENDLSILEKAAIIAEKHENIQAYYKDKLLCFLNKVPLNANLPMLEDGLMACLTCQEELALKL